MKNWYQQNSFTCENQKKTHFAKNNNNMILAITQKIKKQKSHIVINEMEMIVYNAKRIRYSLFLSSRAVHERI